MMLQVSHGGEVGVVIRLHRVSHGTLGLVCGGLDVAGAIRFLCCPVMLRRAVEMVRGTVVMLFEVLRHGVPSRRCGYMHDCMRATTRKSVERVKEAVRR